MVKGDAFSIKLSCHGKQTTWRGSAQPRPRALPGPDPNISQRSDDLLGWKAGYYFLLNYHFPIIIIEII